MNMILLHIDEYSSKVEKFAELNKFKNLKDKISKKIGKLQRRRIDNG